MLIKKLIFNSIDPLEIFFLDSSRFQPLNSRSFHRISHQSDFLFSSLFARMNLKRSCEEKKEGGGGREKLEARAMRIVTYVSIYYVPFITSSSSTVRVRIVKLDPRG